MMAMIASDVNAAAVKLAAKLAGRSDDAISAAAPTPSASVESPMIVVSRPQTMNNTPRKSTWNIELFRHAFAFCDTGAAKDAGHRVVGFVAGVFEDSLAGCLERHFSGPRSPPRVRIVHGEPVLNRVLIRPPETLHDVKIFRRSPEVGLGREVCRVDDEGVTFPPADRVAQPVPDGRRWMLPVDADDSRIVDQLGKDHHVLRRLHDLIEVLAEDVWHERWSRVRRAERRGK